MKPKILRTDAELDICEQYMNRLTAVADVVTTAHYDEAGLIEAARDADLILTCYTAITGPVIEAATRLKGIVKYGVGTDAIDLETASRNDVIVANCPAYGSDTVADHAFALLISLARKVPELDRAMRAQGWAWPIPELLGLDLSGKTMGLVGLGRIGTCMARRCLGFGMTVLACDPYIEDPDGLDVRLCDLDELLRLSDFVSVHCVLTPETKGLIGARELGMMKTDALLIDVSRGAIVDEAALIDALQNKIIGGAGFDVFPDEPLDRNFPLNGMDNVILTPHLAWYTREAFQRVEEQTLQSILDILAGKIPKNLKNTEILSRPLGGAATVASVDTVTRPAFDVPRGHAVARPGTDDGAVFIKAERQGTEYIHHYLIQVTPAPAAEAMLIYVDPEDLLVDLGGRVSFTPGTPDEATEPAVGHIFTTAKGTYLKVTEDPKSQKMFAYIDTTTGEVKRRQERKITTVHMDWRVVLPL
ncbi:MAG: hydroxyacid dehydrogenase [Rhodospirillaceae bacterium]|nr:hydroxyacid dehydrogenase [Rhodospirillaceae bacterium]